MNLLDFDVTEKKIPPLANIIRGVKPEDIEEYLRNGWKIGQKPQITNT